jgi:hypothetical protein
MCAITWTVYICIQFAVPLCLPICGLVQAALLFYPPTSLSCLACCLQYADVVVSAMTRCLTGSDASDAAGLTPGLLTALDDVINMRNLHGEWKSQISTAFHALLRPVLAPHDGEHRRGHRPLAAAILRHGRLPMVDADAVHMFDWLAVDVLGLEDSKHPAVVAGGGVPRLASRDAAWAAAGVLLGPLLRAGRVLTWRVQHLAHQACAAITAALDPVLMPPPGTPEAEGQGDGEQLASAACFGGAALLLAQAAAAAAGKDGGGVAEYGVECLLAGIEGCVTVAAEVGVGERASKALLEVAAAMAGQLPSLLFTAVVATGQLVLPDMLDRLVTLLVG